MNSNKYKLVKVDSKELWNDLVNSSSNYSLFFSLEYLSLLETKYNLWLVMQGTEVKAGLLLIVSENEKNIVSNDFVIYSGIILKDYKNTKIAKKTHQSFQIIEFVAEELTKIYKNITLSLSPEIIDIRPFQWFNYHNDKKKYKIDIKFTSLINISELRKKINYEQTKIFQNLDFARRYNIREAIKEHCIVQQSKNITSFVSNYKLMMSNQNINISKEKINTMTRVIDYYIHKNKGVLLEAKDKHNELLYTAFYLWDLNKAYYMFGAGTQKNVSYQATIANWEAFKYIANNTDIEFVDLEGVNSPKRGWFKLSFGGNLIPYYRISI